MMRVYRRIAKVRLLGKCSTISPPVIAARGGGLSPRAPITQPGLPLLGPGGPGRRSLTSPGARNCVAKRVPREPGVSPALEAPSATGGPALDRGGRVEYCRNEMLSVVIPVLNEAPNLERLLPDLYQKCRGAEVIVVDGGSTDGSAQVVAQYPPAP